MEGNSLVAAAAVLQAGEKAFKDHCSWKHQGIIGKYYFGELEQLKVTKLVITFFQLSAHKSYF